MKLMTERVQLEILGSEDADLMLDYFLDNRSHLSQWEPIRESDFYTLKHWQWQNSENLEQVSKGTGYRFAILDHDRSEVMGVCNFTGLSRGAFQACFLGYSMAERFQNMGYMTEALEAGIEFMFAELKLHRIMANYIPDNVRSAAVLKKLGFEEEGRARSYLKINGHWQDHILTSKINPEQP
ncbi:30S ribosomal protein S5 alanine N-acetyltransferase [Endozoicomonas sp. OPT23]|uniref:GNAT family N-acetyltransferase n=1 Tax=Endozoicomonas sp. OPT23 TaxID=2072845 RepID=UPI00129A2594|nr:GNAT family N-acetyltransferase [Endozoicomonas sp. OPT23]MRI34030.1 30S ribosomal protein S5 alanine N-acetyltransferase [Endozoicomonas sp. OPT23]